MRLSIAKLACACSIVTSSACATSSLSRDELKLIMDTAETSESVGRFVYSAKAPSTTPQAFALALKSQWIRNESESNTHMSYLICDTTPSKSGYERSRLIEIKCGIQGLEENPVQNLLIRTCFNVRLIFNIAKSCSEKENMTIVPYTPWMKMSRTTFINIFGTDTNSTYIHFGTNRFSGFFCDNLSKREIKRNIDIAQEALEQIWSNTDECPSSLFTETYNFFVENKKLQLHLVESSPVAVHYGCVLALVESFASNPFVCDVEQDAFLSVLNHEARWIIQGSVEGREGNPELPLHVTGISGQGQVAQVSDSGVDVNSCYFYDESGSVVTDVSETVDLTKRKIVQYYAKFNVYNNTGDSNGHGTHCAGTVAGKVCPYDDGECSTNSNNETNSDGNAPKSKIAVYDIDNGNYVYPDDANKMFRVGIKAGAYVHSASWGSYGNGYKSRHKDFDAFQHANQDYLVIMAAGNGGKSYSLLEGYKYNIQNSVGNSGKNMLSVCASMNKNDGRGENYVADFSGMGTTSDGRIKPDICAPGKYINSASIGTIRQCNSTTYQGTSMACPGVAGASLLIRQYFMEGWYPSGTKVPYDGFTPSGSLIKAVILNSGKVMLGRDNGLKVRNSKEYDISQGFGLISLVDAIYLEGKSKRKLLVFDKQVLKDGDVAWEKTFQLDDCGAKYTSVTLDYFDKQNDSLSCNPCIINRLDVTVIRGRKTYYPNGKTSPDELNNSQRIRIKHRDGNIITVVVKATNLATSEQKFALAVSGCVDNGTFRPTANPTSSAPTKSFNPSSIPSKIPSPLPSKSSQPSDIPSKSLHPSTNPTTNPSFHPSIRPSVSHSIMPSLFPTKICEDDPEFFLERKGKKKTCKFIGKGDKKGRINKWCRKRKNMMLVSTSCCKTCRKCTKCYYTSCAEIRDKDPSKNDGEYTMTKTVDGVSKRFSVYCHNMKRVPKEYLTLTEGSFSQYEAGGAKQGQTVVTTFTKVGFDVQSMKVDIHDRTFSSSVGKITQGEITSMPFGVAMNCRFPKSSSGRSKINLSGTPFKVVGSFGKGGYKAAGSATYDSSTDTWNISGGGYCGWYMPEPVSKDPHDIESKYLALELDFK